MRRFLCSFFTIYFMGQEVCLTKTDPMKLTLTLALMAFPFLLNAQTVSTYIEAPANIDDCLFIASDGSMYASR